MPLHEKTLRKQMPLRKHSTYRLLTLNACAIVKFGLEVQISIGSLNLFLVQPLSWKLLRECSKAQDKQERTHFARFQEFVLNASFL